MQSTVLAWPRAAKRLVVVGLDVLLALVATWLALTLRLDQPNWPVEGQWLVYGLAPVLFIPIFVRLGLYRAIFRYTGQAALLATAKAVAIYGLLLSAILFWQQWREVPRTLGILQPLIFFLLVSASRAFARFWLANQEQPFGSGQRKFLIFGAGTAGAQTASAMGVSGQFALVGFVDDDASKVGRSVNGVPIYAPDQIQKLIADRGVTDLLLALPSASRSRRKGIIESLHNIPVHIRTLPDWADLASGKVTVQDFKELEIEDLLGRDPVPPNRNLLSRNLTGKVVLVTGAGGSIGSELCRQIVTEQPSHLLLLDHNEFGLYTIHRSWKSFAWKKACLYIWSPCWAASARPNACGCCAAPGSPIPCITPPPTSMCRWWNPTRCRGLKTMCSAPCTWPEPPWSTVLKASCWYLPTKQCARPM